VTEADDEQRRNRIIASGAVAGLFLSVAGDFLLFAAQRCLNWLVLHGFAGGIDASWSTGSLGPITIMTSPLTWLLMALAGVIAGVSAGIFASALLVSVPRDAPEPVKRSDVRETSGPAG